jgi:hypothetical protein
MQGMLRLDNIETWIDLNNFLHVTCSYHYLGWVSTWKYLKQGFGGKSEFLVEKSQKRIQNNDNYKPHAKNDSNQSMFTKVIA